MALVRQVQKRALVFFDRGSFSIPFCETLLDLSLWHTGQFPDRRDQGCDRLSGRPEHPGDISRARAPMWASWTTRSLSAHGA